MFKGTINAKVNRYGQETTEQIRPITRAEHHLLTRPANAVAEMASPDRPTKRTLLVVHPDCFKS